MDSDLFLCQAHLFQQRERERERKKASVCEREGRREGLEVMTISYLYQFRRRGHSQQTTAFYSKHTTAE